METKKAGENRPYTFEAGTVNFVPASFVIGVNATPH